jgi:hypothetical protein
MVFLKSIRTFNYPAKTATESLERNKQAKKCLLKLKGNTTVLMALLPLRLQHKSPNELCQSLNVGLIHACVC